MIPMETIVNDDLACSVSGTSVLSTAGRQLLIGLRMLVAMTVLLGVLYPAVVYGLGRLMADRADGSLVRDAQGTVVGSSLIGQEFTGRIWFQGRPSASSYDAMASGGSNLAANSPELATTIEQRRAAIAAADGVRPDQVPADAMTASASGLDPDISAAYARLQVNRVADARGLEVSAVQQLVHTHVRPRQLGFLGEPVVNVLELNLALQRLRP